MPCWHPIEGFRAPGGQIVFAKRHGWSDLPIKIPCGQCTACRLEKSRQWAMRIMHESSLYSKNVFLTLTYRPENLPVDNSLQLDDWRHFMMRMKKRFGGKSIRFYHCGEYGDQNGRPHDHAILFNHDFDDKVWLKRTDRGDDIFTSKLLDELWRQGDCYIGSVTFESAAYCARYVMKKLTGARAAEYGSRKPEYSSMSRNPGVGAPWLAKWKTDVFPNDFCVMNGKRVRVPKFYDVKVTSEESPIGHWTKDITGFPIWMPSLAKTDSEKRKGKRKKSALKHSADNSPERLAVREEIQRLKLEQLTRS